MTAAILADNLVGLLIAMALFVFLIIALVLPERF